MSTKNVVKMETVSLSEAAEILGLKSFRNVKTLIERGVLKGYRRQWSNRLRVSKEDVEKLSLVEEVSQDD
jgi:hypothetical protein